MHNLDIKKKFYHNICEPLFKKEQILYKTIQIFYDPTKYNEIKKFSKLIRIILMYYYLDIDFV